MTQTTINLKAPRADALEMYRTRTEQTVCDLEKIADAHCFETILAGTPGQAEVTVSESICKRKNVITGSRHGVNEIHFPLSSPARAMERANILLTGDTYGSAGTVQSGVSGDVAAFWRALNPIAGLCTVIPNCTGNVSFVEQIAGVTGGWLGEDVTLEPQALRLKTASTMQPSRLGVFTGANFQLMQQSQADIAAVVTRDLFAEAALRHVEGALVGTGSGQPLGLCNSTAATFALTTDLSDDLLGVIESVEEANLPDDGSCAFITSPKTKRKLASTLRKGSASELLLDDNGQVYGYPVHATSILTAGADKDKILFGRWSDLILGLFGTASVLRDPYSHAEKAQILFWLNMLAGAAWKKLTSFRISATGVA
jgi:HK97 family phage major capsid protein